MITLFDSGLSVNGAVDEELTVEWPAMNGGNELLSCEAELGVDVIDHATAAFSKYTLVGATGPEMSCGIVANAERLL